MSHESTIVLSSGADIISTHNDGGYVSFSGTSMAAPHVTGVLALLLSYSPSATPDDLFQVLTRTTQDISNANLDLGIIDALAAIEALGTENTAKDDSTSCVQVELSIQTDIYGGETAYRFRRASDRKVLWIGNGLESNREYIESECVPATDCYQFEIRDGYGDGIIGPGILLTYDGIVQFKGGDFGFGGYLRFGNGC